MTNDHSSNCADLLTANQQHFDWGYFLDQAARHKVLPLVARNLSRYVIYSTITEPLKYIPKPIDNLLYSGYYVNGLRNTHIYQALHTIADEMTKSDLLIPVRKGGVLAHQLYGDIGLRPMSDIDYLCPEASLSALVHILQTLGYTQGERSKDGRRLTAFTRRKQLYWQLHVNNLLPFRKLTSIPYLAELEVDICKGLFPPNSVHSLSTDDIVQRAKKFQLAGTTLWTLSNEDMLIDLCAHTYKESTTAWWIERNRHFSLMQFCDIAELVRANQFDLDWTTFISRVQSHKITKLMYFSLSYTDAVYSDVIPRHVLEALKPEDARLTVESDTPSKVEAEQIQVQQNSMLTQIFGPASVL